ncbi:flocculation protein FLO11 [Contarinia nasturtii]|uniref:flocculation protein FLO11 n=1 Tax=Contarinia nasturtii TaxID=265458 RepID=UPI0012D3AFAA|nr:flocculation protein FLO11 [Contarinia nasturtii]
MAHGGTQNVPPSEQRSMNNNFCNTCGVTFDSSESLQVHIHNNHNQPVSAAADSSDNQPPTPQSTANGETNQQQQQQQQALNNHYNRHSQEFSNVNSNLNQLPNYHHQPSEMHYPSYMSNYDQYYHQHSIEYGLPPITSHYTLSASQSQPEYKTVPSSNRFHPYGAMSNSLTVHHPYPSHHAPHNHNAQHNQSQNGPAIAAAAAISAAAAQSSMSPSVVTSSSPIQNNLMNSTTVPSSMAQTPQNSQPTPSPSPRQCDKCGVVCDTISQLAEHQATAHNATNNSSESTINRSGGNGDIENDIPSFQYSNFAQPKEEPHPPDCDILDLDSQKMVYPPHDMNQQGPLPPMHSLHPMQRPMMWPPHGPPPPHETNSFLPIPSNHNQNDLKPPMFGSIKNEFSPQIIKQEAPHHLTQLPSTPTNPPQSELSKSFGGSDGSQTSPSEFPSTTTPQDGPQFRTFEAATSSLPNGGPIMKATSWKSNEARRPKTYNCTACNKWFTSSGHLKRHYNTTLHKNAVKSSGQPDPATLPISAHHHPARDPNSKHHRYNNNKTTHNNNSIVQQQSAQQVQAPPQQQQSTLPNIDSTRTTEFASQFTPFAPQSQPTNPMGFQQYPNSMQSNASIHPNAQAGLCGPVSQPRDLLTYSDLTGVHSSSNNSSQLLVQDFIQVPQMQQILPESTIMQSITSMEHCNIITPITINTSITQSYPHMQRPAEDPNYIIGNHMMHTGNSNQSTTPPMSYYSNEYDEHYDNVYHNLSDDEKDIKCFPNTIPAITALRRLNNDIQHADTVPPFSPDIPDKRMSVSYQSPQSGEIVPSHLSPNAPNHCTADIPKNEASIGNEPSSPSITSTNAFEHFPSNKCTNNANTNGKNRKTNKRRTVIDTSKLITDTIPAGNDPLRCDPCDKVFNKACYLTQHNKTFHSGEKPFKCQRCGKRFPCDQTHTEHMAKHNGNKPFKCNQCVKQFNHKTDLRRHMCLHTGTKPYICEICQKGFIRKDHMVKHGLTHLKRKNGGDSNTPSATKAKAAKAAAAAAAEEKPTNEQLSSTEKFEQLGVTKKQRGYVLEIDLNAPVNRVKYKQSTIDAMLTKTKRKKENKENIQSSQKVAHSIADLVLNFEY